MFIKSALRMLFANSWGSRTTGLSNYWDVEFLDTTCSTIQILDIFLTSVASDNCGVEQMCEN